MKRFFLDTKNFFIGAFFAAVALIACGGGGGTVGIPPVHAQGVHTTMVTCTTNASPSCDVNFPAGQGFSGANSYACAVSVVNNGFQNNRTTGAYNSNGNTSTLIAAGPGGSPGDSLNLVGACTGT